MLLHNFLSPYRVPLFAELAGRFDLDVWILGDIRSVREWPSEAPDAGFRYRVLPHVTIPLGSRYNVVLLNYTLPSELARLRPDAIIFCAWDTPAAFYTAWHARRTRTPFVLWSGSTASENTLLRSLTRPLVRGLVRRADAFLAYGSRARDYLVSLGADPGRTHLAYNTVETAQFARSSRISSDERETLRARLGIATERMLLYCGNLLELKGVGDLLASFARFAREDAGTTLLLVGSGRDEPHYRRFVQAEGLEARVIFAGFVARNALPQYYALADLLVLPSRSEIWGLVINEALACGLPVLATDVCGATADILQDGVNGYIVPARNSEALCEALRRHFSTRTNQDALREAARRSIEPFTLARTADAFEAAVAQACERT